MVFVWVRQTGTEHTIGEKTYIFLHSGIGLSQEGKRTYADFNSYHSLASVYLWEIKSKLAKTK